ncbi:MAG: hypothetical protein JRI75_11210 [Deltaproteobacteria bacterium]|nr:hypothetical protein [Deltaproteobacteria bacterium]
MIHSIIKKRCSKVILFFFAVTAVALLFSGCGIKAPPVPPRQVPPPAVNDLTESIVGDLLELTWTYSMDKKNENSGVSGFIVYRSRQKLSDPVCEDCPITFERAQDIPIGVGDAEQVIKGVMTYNEILEKGFRYRYKITVYTDKGVAGSDSNIVDFEH